MSQVDPDIFFLRRHSIEIIETVLADEAKLTYTHIELARSNKWYPGISIHLYLKLLRCWKVMFRLYKKRNYAEIKNSIDEIEELTSNQKVIFSTITDKWINDSVITYAMSDNIERFKSREIDFDLFLECFIAKKNPYSSMEQ